MLHGHERDAAAGKSAGQHGCNDGMVLRCDQQPGAIFAQIASQPAHERQGIAGPEIDQLDPLWQMPQVRSFRLRQDAADREASLCERPRKCNLDGLDTAAGCSEEEGDRSGPATRESGIIRCFHGPRFVRCSVEHEALLRSLRPDASSYALHRTKG